MAGIQIPRVERFQQQDTTPASPKLNIDAPNLGKGGSQQLEAVGNIVQDQADYFAKQEKAAIDTASKAAANEYNIYLNAELNKAKLQQGDPTQTYAQFNENMNLKFDEILNKNPNLSEAGRSAVKSHLADVFTNYSMKANTAYSGQYYDYDKQVTDDAVKLTSQDFMVAASYIDPKDEKSFQGIDALITRIGNLYKTHGEKFGAVTRDENGNQVATDGINLQIGKATSEGLISAINNLNNSNRPDLAEALYAKYYKYIDTRSQDDVLKRISNKKDKLEVFSAVDQTKGMSVSQIDSFLSKKFKDNPELKDKAFDEIASRSNKEKTIRENQSKQAADSAIAYVKKKVSDGVKSGNIYDLSAMENDPIAQRMMINITDHKDVKAVEQIITNPKVTDPKAMVRFNEALSSGKIRGMSPEDLEKLKVGVKDSDRSKMDDWWRRFNSQETLPQEKTIMDAMSKRLEKSMQDQKYVKTKTKFNPWSREDERKYNELWIELGDNIDNYKHLPMAEAYKRVDELVARKIKGIITSDPDREEETMKRGSGLSNKIMTLKDRKQIYNDLKSKFNGSRSPTHKEIQDEFNRRNQ